MSTDFENAVIAYAQTLSASWTDAKAREKCKRELLHIIDVEYGEDNAYSNALKAIVEKADADADGHEQDRRSEG